jgi:hypothetical protein
MDGDATTDRELWRRASGGEPDCDHGDPGTVLDPPYWAIQVRGRTGTAVGSQADSLIWAEPGGTRWSLTSRGVSPAQLLDIAEAMVLTGPDPALPDAADRDLHPLAVPTRPKLPGQVWVTDFAACYRAAGAGAGADCSLRLTVREDELPWQTRPVGRLVRLAGGAPALLSAPTDPSLVWQPARGVQAILSGPGLATARLLAIAGTIEPAAPSDPRLQSIWRP